MKSERGFGEYLSWTLNGALLFLVLCAVYAALSPADAPVNLKAWHAFSNYCYRRAYRWGQLGMAAETAYWNAVEKVRP